MPERQTKRKNKHGKKLRLILESAREIASCQVCASAGDGLSEWQGLVGAELQAIGAGLEEGMTVGE